LASLFEVNVCPRSSIWLFLLLSIFIRTAQAGPAIAKIPDVRHVARSSALIFSGKVLSVDRQPGNSVSPATTFIQLQVLEAIRGVRKGQVIQIREWGGLWDAGERYHKGEQVLLFLYPPGKTGLTSPVGGRDGRFQMDGAGRVLLKGNGNQPARIVPVRNFITGISRSERD
jgi:hypothetical protein